ncbi:hypothetical protein KY285_025913 [Solanum tuberosum]|nr:hypothetical protein KY285_025913 [Solanum tuberosum]
MSVFAFDQDAICQLMCMVHLLDGSSGSGFARDLHDEPSQGPMASIKVNSSKEDLGIGVAKTCKARCSRAKCWVRTTTQEAEPQWKALRGRTCAQCMHEGTRKSGRPETNFGVKFEGCLRVPHTCMSSWRFPQFLAVGTLSADSFV